MTSSQMSKAQEKEYKINILKSETFLCTSQEHAEKKSQASSSFTIKDIHRT